MAAGRSSALVVMALGMGMLFSMLYVSAQSGSGRIAYDPHVIPTAPKVSQLGAIESAENHLLAKVRGAQNIRLEFTLYNFSQQKFEADREYAKYRMERLEWRGWPLSQVKENPDLLNLGLFFVHANQTQYFVNSTSRAFTVVCEKPSLTCPLPVKAVEAARDRLVYRAVLTWEGPPIPINESLYLVDAETGEVVWSYVDFEMHRLPMPNVNFDNKTMSQIFKERVNPPHALNVDIEEGASLESSQRSYLPKEVRATVGMDNKVIWTNRDIVPQSVVSDSGYVDRLTGKKFDSGLIPPGGTFEFVFTEPGEYPYHGEPHPWMRGKVTVVENFA